MGYDMKKIDIEKWEYYKNLIDDNVKKYKSLFFHKKKFVKEIYYQRMNKNLNLDNPKTFTEKLNMTKLNNHKMRYYAKFADKVEVRKYVERKIGRKYLIPQYFVKNHITIEDLKELPNQFVLKTNNGSGTNYIVLDKSKEDLALICNYLNSLVKLEYGYIYGEFLYNYIKPKIIAEKLLLNDENEIPDDLKCFCFKDDFGNKKKILYCERVINDERLRIMFDENWKVIDYKCDFKKLNISIKRPKNYKEILKIIDILSDEFNFVRVDLYVLKNRIYFGELTFIPTAGYLKFDDDKIDLEWGSYIGTKYN